MSEITYVCPFRKNTKIIGAMELKETFADCDFERCSLCEMGETSTSKSYYCQYPNYGKGWLIKREIKQF